MTFAIISNLQPGSERYCFVIDAFAEPQINSVNGKLEPTAETLKANGFNLYFAYSRYNENLPSYLSLATDGICSEMSITDLPNDYVSDENIRRRYNFGDFAYSTIFNETDSYLTFTATGWTQIELDEPITEKYRSLSMAIENDPSLHEQIITLNIYADTDRDGLLDLEEIYFNRGDRAVIMFDENGKAILPTFERCIQLEESLFYVEKGLERYAPFFDQSAFDNIRILPIKSDPTNKDGDEDGILDKYDGEALIENRHSDYIIDCINKEEIKFTDIISDGQVAICTIPITKLGFEVAFEPKVCYDEYGDPYKIDPISEEGIISGYFDNWYIVENLSNSEIKIGLVYTKNCQKFIDIHSSPFKSLIKALDAYPQAIQTIYDGYVEDGVWSTTGDVLSGAISSVLESIVSDLGQFSDIISGAKKLFTPSNTSDLYLISNSSSFDNGTGQSYQAQFVYSYQQKEKILANVDSDSYQAAKTLGYSTQILKDFGVFIAGGIVGTGGDIIISGSLSLLPESGGTSIAFVIPGEIAAVAGAGITATGAFLITSDEMGFNTASQAMRDAKMFDKDNTKLTEPSHSYDNNAEPRRRKTKIYDKMDDETRTSTIMENEAAETIAKNGYDIEQNPAVSNTSRKPDYRIEGEIFDCYSPEVNTSARSIWSTVNNKVYIRIC